MYKKNNIEHATLSLGFFNFFRFKESRTMSISSRASLWIARTIYFVKGIFSLLAAGTSLVHTETKGRKQIIFPAVWKEIHRARWNREGVVNVKSALIQNIWKISNGRIDYISNLIKKYIWNIYMENIYGNPYIYMHVSKSCYVFARYNHI